MISVELAAKLNKIISDASGGESGIRDIASLSSALNRPFIDGNKRMAYALMRLLLAEEGFTIKANEEEIYKFVISASKGELRFEQMKQWIDAHIKN